MKPFTHMILPIAILMAAVGGVAYFTQFTKPSRPIEPISRVPDSTAAPTEGNPITLDVPEEQVEDRSRPLEVEADSHNHKDVWFHTEQEKAVSVGLWHQSCKCTNVELGSFDLTQEECDALAKAPTLGLLCKLVGTAKFEKLPDVAKGQPYVPIQPTPTGRAPRPYVLRINWDTKGKTVGTMAERVGVEVNARVGNGTPSKYKQEVGYQVVPATALWPAKIELGEVLSNQPTGRDCYIWSVTRSQLDFTVRMTAARGDPMPFEPCAEIGTPEPLSSQEIADLPRRLGKDFTSLHPLCAYRFRVALHERRGDSQLEMGSLHRQLLVTFNTRAGEHHLNDLKAPVTALVRGNLQLQSVDDDGRILIPSFKFDRGKSLQVNLISSDPTLELEVDKESLPNDKTHVALDAPTSTGGRREWRLKIDIEPVAFLGAFEWAITIRTKGANSRRLRIPVIGTAER